MDAIAVSLALLSSLATDLDLMLNDLRSTPPRFIQPRTSVSIVSHLGSEAVQLRSRRLPLGNSVDSENIGHRIVEDDLQSLLPISRGLSHDELNESHGSLVSSSDGGILAEGEETSSESSSIGSTSPPCDLGLVERLLRTHPVWFLPGIQRAGAVHLLQGKEEGNFVVRGSSQVNTMAVSVRLPPDTGPYIEHYLIQSNEGILSLESSRFKFESIPGLIAHYAQCCDELPVQLTLPRALREAKNRQQLSSLALLGQEFWRYPMASPKIPQISTSISTSSTSSSSSSASSSVSTTTSIITSSISLTNANSPLTQSNSSGIGTTIFSTQHQHIQNNHLQQSHLQQKNLIVTTSNNSNNNSNISNSINSHSMGTVFSPTNPLSCGGSIFSQAGTPSDTTTSSLSSFTSTNGGGGGGIGTGAGNHQQIVQMLSPESIDSNIMSPIEPNCGTGIIGKTSTFKALNRRSMDVEKVTSFLNNTLIGQNGTTITATVVDGNNNNNNNNNNICNFNNNIRNSRPTPPNTLNLGPLRTPPAPPPRWSKPTTPSSPSTPVDGQITNNFTVTTTVTFSVDGNQNSQVVELTSPNTTTNGTFQTISKRLSPEGECKTQVDTLSSQGSKQWQSQSSKDSSTKNSRKILSPNSVDTPTGRTKRTNKARKESKHYQESDILESPQIYCRSALGDKISDYEDLWTQENTINNNNTSTPTNIDRGSSHLSSFRPEINGLRKRPNLLSESPLITSLSGNLLSPAGSVASSSNSSVPSSTNKQHINNIDINPNNQSTHYFSNNNQNVSAITNDKLNDITTPMSTPIETNRKLQALAIAQEIQQQSEQKLNAQNPMLQPRNRLGLILPLQTVDSVMNATSPTTTGAAAAAAAAAAISSPTTSESVTITPTSQTTRNKQNSPFYAEPADALENVVRRSQRNPLLIPLQHRHSEPQPKTNNQNKLRTPFCQVLSPIESEKSPISGSLDELQHKNKKHKEKRNGRIGGGGGRLDPWPLDSSWEFMSNNNDENDNDGDVDDDDSNNNNIDNDYDTDANWKTTPGGNNIISKKSSNNNQSEKNSSKSITIHQIIAKRLPDLNLPELIKLSTPPAPLSSALYSPELLRSSVNGGVVSNNAGNVGAAGSGGSNNTNAVTSTPSQLNQKNNRMSSYDNVERNHSGYATSSMLYQDSAQSDDGTVFSEPWDSSQWDSFLPHDDTSETIHLSKYRPAICNSEDDTIIDEISSSFNNNNNNQQQQQHQQPHHVHQSSSSSTSSQPHHIQHQQSSQKVATIIRSRSCRDREILCHPRNKIITNGPGDSIGAYALELANDHTTTFSRNIENFITCTKDSRELAPQIVMRNMRQFMSGMKNYLVKHGEGDFQNEVLRARSRLKPDEFLNLDTILENVMHQLVVLPLREHLYGLFVDYYTRTGDIQLLVENIKYASGRSATDFGIRATLSPPTLTAMQHISLLLLRLQEAELPCDKLELLLTVVAAIFDTSANKRNQSVPLAADDFLPLLVYIVAKTGFIGAEIEAEFMWCLLQPSLLNGEAGYYLTALCSAVHVLKSFMSSEMDGVPGSLDIRSSSLPASSSVLRVIIPDECNGSLQTRTLPVRPHTTTREVCRTIAHKARITNPQDYGLFKLVDGEETLLLDSECPQDARIAARGKHCMLAYKRIDAKIAWPTSTCQ